MKILLVNKFFYPKGGAENYFFQIAATLESKGHKVIFFSMQHPKNYPSAYNQYFIDNVNYENLNPLNIIKASGRILYSFTARKKIERLIKNQRPDIAHLNNTYHQISPSILHSLRKYDIPVVTTLHDCKMVCASYLMFNNGKICEACKDGKYYYCFLKKCVKNSRAKSLLNVLEMYLHHKILNIYDFVDVFISPSQFLESKLREMGCKKKIVPLMNFVRTEDFEPHYDWEENSIVYFGRLSEEKGLFTLLEAVKGLDVRLKIIGDGPLKESLKLKVESEKLDNILFLGYKSGRELKDEIRKSMFTVLTSQCYENNPMSIIEGFALGKPAVGAHIGGIPELIRDNETGLTFEPGNSESLALKIKSLIEKPDKIVEMGKNARRFVENELSNEIHYQRLMEIYNQVIDHKSKRL